MQDNFSLVKERVSAPEVWKQYGGTPIVRGLVHCIHHKDKRPSMKLYDGNRGYYCFACLEGGDVIKLTSALLGLTPLDTIRQLSKDFNIPLTVSGPPSADEIVRVQQERQRRKAQEENKNTAFRALADYHRRLFHAHEDQGDPLYEESLFELDKVAYLLDELIDDPDSVLAGWESYINCILGRYHNEPIIACTYDAKAAAGH